MLILSLAFFCFLLEIFIATRVMRASLIHPATFRQQEAEPVTPAPKPE
jgi:hypothetical protein